MSIPGRLLSQPANVTSASRRSACITHSTESAMISRLTSEPRIPSWPIEMPSLTAMVTNSSGKPPASRTPSFARLASRSSGTLHGVTSFQLEATPTCALPQSASVIPTARSMARAGARSIPSVTSWLRGFMFSVMTVRLGGAAPRPARFGGVPVRSGHGGGGSDLRAMPGTDADVMKVDAPLVAAALSEVPRLAREIESMGYDGVYTFEGPHDPFFPLALAAEHTERLDLATAIAVGFARSPMNLAPHRLGPASRCPAGGRSSVSARRSSRTSRSGSRCPGPGRRPGCGRWCSAIRAIWATWQDGTPLRFEGEFYRHTLMTPFFTPEPTPHGLARIFLAGVGPAMTEVAGEVGGRIPRPSRSARSSSCASTPCPHSNAA